GRRVRAVPDWDPASFSDPVIHSTQNATPFRLRVPHRIAALTRLRDCLVISRPEFWVCLWSAERRVRGDTDKVFHLSSESYRVRLPCVRSGETAPRYQRRPRETPRH